MNGSDPAVYCGSSNLASGGEAENGDNLLEIHDADVATAFAIEALGLVDHYNFLDRMANPKKSVPKKKPAANAGAKQAAPKKKASASARAKKAVPEKKAAASASAKKVAPKKKAGGRASKQKAPAKKRAPRA